MVFGPRRVSHEPWPDVQCVETVSKTVNGRRHLTRDNALTLILNAHTEIAKILLLGINSMVYIYIVVYGMV